VRILPNQEGKNQPESYENIDRGTIENIVMTELVKILPFSTRLGRPAPRQFRCFEPAFSSGPKMSWNTFNPQSERQ